MQSHLSILSLSCWVLFMFYLGSHLYYYFPFFIMIYSLYRRGFIVTIPIKLILYISYSASTISLSIPSSPPTTFKEIARGFFVLFHIGIWSPSIIFPHLNLFHSLSLLPLVPSPQVNCTYFTVLYFIIII
jgi:hypothetical protein